MSDLRAAAILVSVLCIGVAAAATVRIKGRSLDSRTRAKWLLAVWCVVMATGVAVWLLARSQMPN